MISFLRHRLNSLPRVAKSLGLAAYDAVALVIVLWLSFQLRLGGTFEPTNGHYMIMSFAPIIALPIFLRLGLYRAVIRYLPERFIWTIVQAMAIATLIWVFVVFVAEASRLAVFPRSIPILYFILGVVAVGGARFAAKYLLWDDRRNDVGRTTMLIYGAGDAGRQLATALRMQGGGFVAGFVDDDPNLQGRDVMGLRVYRPDKVADLIRDMGVQEIVLSMPSVDTARRRDIVTELNKLPIKIRTLPSITEIASGKYAVSNLREIDIDDLLGRSSVPAEPELLGPMIEGRAIMVTGGGGSIGSELCRIICDWKPKTIVVLEANEHALYQIERRLKKDAGHSIVPVLGSVTDEGLVRRTLRAHAIDAVFHAAAHKHVPLVEANVIEGVRNNVFGTRVVAEAALSEGVKDFILVSTDKAVRPTNVMGASKRWAELVVHETGSRALEAGKGQRFCAVRFGNVLGSNGSVVPLFREQIAAGGPVTVTDERMTRYFMSIHEAAELIIQAGTLSEGDDLFLLDMGQPVKIFELARDMIQLGGLTVKSPENPRGDIEITLTGARPGEKLFEELLYDPSRALTTRHPKIMRARMLAKPAGEVKVALAKLSSALETADEQAVRKLLFEFIAEPSNGNGAAVHEQAVHGA